MSGENIPENVKAKRYIDAYAKRYVEYKNIYAKEVASGE
jgi:hypothetical protein